jgi:hypothetical protein
MGTKLNPSEVFFDGNGNQLKKRRQGVDDFVWSRERTG